MSALFDSFTRQIHEVLAADPGPAGREQVCLLLQDILLRPEIAELVGDEQPQRRVLYADPTLHFEVLGHVYHEAKRTKPHDHGPGWAIYGQVSGESLMDEWRVVEPAQADRPGKVTLVRTLHLEPGQARLYNEQELHAPRRVAPARLIRIEGPGVKGSQRQAWDIV